MRLSNRTAILTAVITLVFVIPLAGRQQLSSNGDSRASNVPSEVASLRNDWVNHWNAKDLTSLVETYAPDAVLLPPSGQVVRGRDAIASYWRQSLQNDARTLTLEPASGDAFEDVAYESGHLTYDVPGLTPSKTGNAIDTPGATKRHVNASYLMVLRRGADKKWRIVQHAFNEAFLKSMVEEKHPPAKPMKPTEER